jgi:Pyridine nucleotide-disulphide oxidoreductase
LPFLPFGGKVISSTESLATTEVPVRLVVVGAGYIGLELGTALAELGAGVTIVETLSRVLPQHDADLTRPVARRLRFRTSARHSARSPPGWRTCCRSCGVPFTSPNSGSAIRLSPSPPRSVRDSDMTTLKVLLMVSRHRRHSFSWHRAVFRKRWRPNDCGPHFSPIVSAIRWRWWWSTGRWYGWRHHSDRRISTRNRDGRAVLGGRIRRASWHHRPDRTA